MLITAFRQTDTFTVHRHCHKRMSSLSARLHTVAIFDPTQR